MNTMSLVLSLGRRKAKDQPPERDGLRQATFGPGSASAPTQPHLLLPLRQPPRENRRHLAQGEPEHQEQQPEGEDEDHEAKGDSQPAGTPTSITLSSNCRRTKWFVKHVVLQETLIDTIPDQNVNNTRTRSN